MIPLRIEMRPAGAVQDQGKNVTTSIHQELAAHLRQQSSHQSPDSSRVNPGLMAE